MVRDLQLEQLERVLEGSGIGLWDWDLVTNRTTHSRMNNRLLGFDDTDWLGETFEEITARVHPDDLATMLASAERHLRGETSCHAAEFRVRRSDGTYAWFESRGVVVERGSHGEPLRMLGTHVDISHRKVNEQLRRDLDAALRRNQEELEALVRRQTQKLVEAADAAEQGNRAKNVFLANVAEQLRGPIQVLASATAGLSQAAPEALPPRAREHLDRVLVATRDLAGGIERLLDVSSIESGTLEVCATPVVLRRVLEEQCEAMQDRARERGLDLRGVSCAEDLVVFADRARLAQVVRELLDNAIRCTDRGHVQVRAKVLDGTVMVEVQDTGVGISAERQATLFHAFRPDSDRQHVLRQGAGLGLSISRAIIDAMAGTMGVTSRPGRGSRFWFTVPLAASAERISSTRH
jgi:PAS domain S-box-containing protein